ncbi:hypothetical protein [Pseudomonas sp.]|jgi:hypothetical protein|uniref:hypothetical protein n=1 Tax=Pseudomonas sp. TaxID=306 RepID=UPI0037C9498B
MSQFYNTYAALVAHLQETADSGQLTIEQRDLLSKAECYLASLKDVQSTARLAELLAQTLDAIHDELSIQFRDIQPPLDDLLNGTVCASTHALRSMGALLAN